MGRRSKRSNRKTGHVQAQLSRDAENETPLPETHIKSALKIVLREVTHTQVNMKIYEAGILLCISTFIKRAKDQGCLR